MNTSPNDPLLSLRPEARGDLDDCWNRIGGQGDRSCPKLAEYVHCRNCPVHAAAALQRLDGDLPDGYQAEWSRHFAQVKPAEEAHTRTVVIFRLGREWLALPTTVFKEVAPLRPVHSLPHRRGGVVSGLVNVRGELLVCIALERVLGIEPDGGKSVEKKPVHPRLLVLNHQGQRLVFQVDEVYGVQRFAPRELQEVPAALARHVAALTSAILPWRERTVGCLDEQKLFATLNRSLG